MVGKVIVAAAATGTGVYLLHPEKGRQRRAELSRRAADLIGNSDAPPQAPGAAPSNDADLAQRVRTQAVGTVAIPAGSVNVNAEMEIVYLRGEVPDATIREALIQAAEAVEGVRHVESLLHLPGEQAPTKHETPAETRRRVEAQAPPR